MRIFFQKSADGRPCHAGLPHDLAQVVVEAGLGLEHGFWNLVANRTRFRSLGGARPGRGGSSSRPTGTAQPG
jgi:hypothetical protein